MGRWMFRGVVVFPLVPLLVLLGGFPAAAQGSISLSPSSGPVGTTVVLSAAQVQQMGGVGPLRRTAGHRRRAVSRPVRRFRLHPEPA